MNRCRHLAYASLIVLGMHTTLVHAQQPAVSATTQPVVRTITVIGEATKSYAADNQAARDQAVADTYAGAYVNAQQRAEQAAKLLSVHVGLPITVDVPIVDPNGYGESRTVERNGMKFVEQVTSICHTTVRIVFELHAP